MALVALRASAQTPDTYRYCFDRFERHFQDWSELLGFWREGRCPEIAAVFGECWADEITLLLATRWEQLERLEAEAPEGTRERAFVLAYIDVTSPADRLLRIDELSRRSCPADLKALCTRIQERIRDAR
jgi:hypothetical protein